MTTQQTDTPLQQSMRAHYGEWIGRYLSLGYTPGQIAKAIGQPLKRVRWLIEEEEGKRKGAK